MTIQIAILWLIITLIILLIAGGSWWMFRLLLIVIGNKIADLFFGKVPGGRK